MSGARIPEWGQRRNTWGGEEGQTVLLALSLVMLLGFVGLVVDLGFLRYAERHMRSAADAGALGAAADMLYSNNSGGVVAAGKADASKGGFSDGVNGVTVNVYNPPNDGPHSCANDANCNQYVEALISQNQPTFFMRALNINSVPLSGRAVAWMAGNGTGCVYALDPTTNNAFVVSGGSTKITAPKCDILVDSDSSNSAYVASGGGCVASMIGVVGGDQWDGDCTKPILGIVPAGDPLAYVQAPAVGSCPNPPPSLPTGCTYQNNGGLKCTATPPTDLQPGTYCSGITVDSPATVTFAAGTYVLNGGGFTVQGGANVIGNGVTFYNTGDASGSTEYKPVVISGGSTTSLTAPTSGSLAGILFFQDRNIPSSFTGPSGPQNTISGGSGSVITGALYFSTTPLVISGGSSLSAFTLTVAAVADTFTVSGGSNVTLQSLPSLESPVHQVVLVE